MKIESEIALNRWVIRIKNDNFNLSIIKKIIKKVLDNDVDKLKQLTKLDLTFSIKHGMKKYNSEKVIFCF